MTKQELFTKVTGLTFDVEKLSPEKLAWLIPDGSMLDNNSPKFELTKEFMEVAGLNVDGKVDTKVESTANNEDPKKKPSGKGWKKVVDVPGVEAVEGVDEHWIFNGVTYTEDPTYETLDTFEVISDESSWNASFASGVLKAYYEKNPSEDLWNTATNSAPGFNDKIYTVKMYTDAACEGEFVTKQFKAQWYSDNGVQKIIDVEDSSIEYYIPTFFDTPKDIFELFCGAEGGYVATPNDLVNSASRYIKVESVSFGGDNVGHSYQGWIAAGAQIPWICINFMNSDPGVKVTFKYEGKSDVNPWGDTLFGNGNGHKSWGIASLPQEFGAGSYDVANLQIVLENQGVEHVPAVEAVEAVEEQYHWERTISE